MKTGSVTALAIGPVIVAVTTSLSSPSTDASADVVLVGAGDIALCSDLSGAQARAELLDGIPGIVFSLGATACARPRSRLYAGPSAT